LLAKRATAVASRPTRRSIDHRSSYHGDGPPIGLSRRPRQVHQNGIGYQRDSCGTRRRTLYDRVLGGRACRWHRHRVALQPRRSDGSTCR